MRLVKYFMVTVILIFIFLLIIPHSPPHPSESESNSAKSRAFLSILNSVLLGLKLDIGRLPNTGEGLALLFESSENIKGWKGPYLLKSLLAEMHQYNEIIYRSPAACNKSLDYDLYLRGENGIDECGKGDDISFARKIGD